MYKQTGFQRVDPKRVILDRITGAIMSTVFGGIILTTMAIATLTVHLGSEMAFDRFFWVTLVAWGSSLFLVLAIFILNFVWPRLKYNATFWRLGEDGLEIWRGVIWRHQLSVPRARVQHADVVQGPLQRHYGIATLIVHTAGTKHNARNMAANVSAPGLSAR